MGPRKRALARPFHFLSRHGYPDLQFQNSTAKHSDIFGDWPRPSLGSIPRGRRGTLDPKNDTRSEPAEWNNKPTGASGVVLCLVAS